MSVRTQFVVEGLFSDATAGNRSAELVSGLVAVLSSEPELAGLQELSSLITVSAVRAGSIIFDVDFDIERALILPPLTRLHRTGALFVGSPVLELRVLNDDGSWAVVAAASALALEPPALDAAASVPIGPIAGGAAAVVLGAVVAAVLLVRRRNRRKLLMQPELPCVPPAELGSQSTAVRIHP